MRPIQSRGAVGGVKIEIWEPAVTDAADDNVIVAMETEQLVQTCPSEQQYDANTGNTLHGAGLWQSRYDKSHHRGPDGGIYISFSTNQEMV